MSATLALSISTSRCILPKSADSKEGETFIIVYFDNDCLGLTKFQIINIIQIPPIAKPMYVR